MDIKFLGKQPHLLLAVSADRYDRGVSQASQTLASRKELCVCILCWYESACAAVLIAV